MKILHLCLGNYYADNFGYQENILSKYHKKNRFDVVIIASRINYNTKNGSQFLDKTGCYLNEHGIKIKRIEYKFGFNDLILRCSRILGIYDKTYKHIEEEKPDIIFVHNPQFWDLKQVVKYKKKNKDVIIYADNHGDYINSARNFLSKNILHKIIWRYRIREFLPHCEKIWGVTPNRCKFLKEMYGVPGEKIGLLPMGADSDNIDFPNRSKIRNTIRNKYSLRKDDFVLFTGGKIDERKKIHKLINAINELANPRIKLLLIGTPNEQMMATIEKISNTKYIRKVGWVKPKLIYDYLFAADLAVFPGTHSVLWEQAVGAGLPGIFKRWEGMAHVDVGGNCIFIKDSKVQSIKQAIEDVYYNEHLYKKMKLIARTKGIPTFSYEEIAKRSIGYIKNV